MTKKNFHRAVLASIVIILALIPTRLSSAEQELPASDRVDRNVRAFMFTLEFALGAPFTGAQEEIIMDELRKGWAARSEAELRKFDSYPKLAEAIIKASDAGALEDVRRQLEKTIRDWLAGSHAEDPAVAAIRSKLDEKGKILIAGTPPLTAMAADAYSEMYAYSELLAQTPDARPDQVPAGRTAEIKARLVEAWPGLGAEARGQVASTPVLWVSLRSVLSFGSQADQANIRAEIGKIAAPASGEAGAADAPPATANRAVAGSEAAGSLVKHQVLMNIQAMTFKQYLYCHGFKSTFY